MRVGKWVTAALVVALVFSTAAFAATEQAKQQAIDDGLAWLATQQSGDGHFEYGGVREDLAATSSALLAFIEEGYLPNDGSAYGEIVRKGMSWVFARAYTAAPPWETAVFAHHAEDYNGNGVLDDGGNNRMLYFHSTDIYSNGVTAPLMHALGEKLGKGTTVAAAGITGPGAVVGDTWSEVMQDVTDWFAWGQVEPNRGNQRGGWRYYPNSGNSDNSTAQWGSLPILYAQDWGLGVAPHVLSELELWVNYIQNPISGGSGYSSPTSLVNMSKTGGLLLELAAIGETVGDSRVDAALNYISTNWNQWVSGWNGNFNNAYAMWAIFKGIQAHMPLHEFGFGAGEDFLIGEDIPGAPGGFTIGQDWDPKTSTAGDWYSHYSDWLVARQNSAGYWSTPTWTTELAAGWYINILNATGAPPPVVDPIPEPGSLALVGVGLLGFAWIARRRRRS